MEKHLICASGKRSHVSFVCGKRGMPSTLADLIVEADNVIGF